MTAPLHPLQVRYRWTLDADGKPLSIASARHSVPYFCPLCGGQMIARLGSQVAHHFSHEEYSPRCTAEAVNHALLRRWIALRLEKLIDGKAQMEHHWQCEICGETHSTDILANVAGLQELPSEGANEPDPSSVLLPIVLLDSAQKPVGLIFMSPQPETTDPTVIEALQKRLYSAAEAGLPVYTIPADATPSEGTTRLNPGMNTLSTLLTLISDDLLCTRLGAIPNLIRGTRQIRKLLLDTVGKFPEYGYVEIKTINGLRHMARWGDKVLWLPPDLWEARVGGALNRLAQDVHILSQTWPHPQGGSAIVHYVVARNTAAIGIRRYTEGIEPVLSINADVHANRTQAVDIVRGLVKITP